MGQARRRTNSAEMERRRARAVELLALGRTYDQIADDLGYKSKTSAITLVKTALKEHVSQNVEALQAVRARELIQLESMEAALLPAVVGKNLEQLPTKDQYVVYEAVDRIVKIKERRAKMLGIDHTTDVNLTGNGQIQVVLDGKVVEKNRSAVEVEVPADTED